MAQPNTLPPLFTFFNSNSWEKDPTLLDQKPEAISLTSELVCHTSVDLNNLENIESFVDIDPYFDEDQDLFGKLSVVEQEVDSELSCSDSFQEEVKKELDTEDEVETDSGRGSFSENESMDTDEEETDDDEEEEETTQARHEQLLSHLDAFVAKKKISERARKRAAADFEALDAAFVLNCHAADIWKLNCELGLEFRDYLRRLYPQNYGVSSSKGATPSRPSPPKRQSCRRRKVYIHTFCLDLLFHPRKYGSVVEWIDTKALTFRVIDTQIVAHLWCLVKGNSLEDYETFGRGIRFSMQRGFFSRMRPQKKKTYRLTEKALRNYNSYRPGLVPTFRR